MCLSGAAMLFIALFSPDTEKGNVIPGLVIAVLGVITNTWFWLRYRRLNRENRMRYLRYKAGFIVQRLLSMLCNLFLTFVAVAPAHPLHGMWI